MTPVIDGPTFLQTVTLFRKFSINNPKNTGRKTFMTEFVVF